jgi:TRAP-type C4-dicarboxylate transport system permease small subunit
MVSFRTIIAALAGISVLVAVAICGWIAWRGRLNDNQPTSRWVIRWVKMVLAVSFILLLALFLFFCWLYKDFGSHDMGH